MRKKYFLIILFIILFVISIILVYLCNKKYVFTPSDGIYFNMSENSIIKIEGQPEEKIENISDTSLFVCNYTNKFDDYILEKSYYFFPTNFSSELYSVDFVYIVESSEKVDKLFNEIYERVNNYYSKKHGYYANDISRIDDENYYIEFGIKIDGATGIDANIQRNGNEIILSSVYQH